MRVLRGTPATSKMAAFAIAIAVLASGCVGKFNGGGTFEGVGEFYDSEGTAAVAASVEWVVSGDEMDPDVELKRSVGSYKNRIAGVGFSFNVRGIDPDLLPESMQATLAGGVGTIAGGPDYNCVAFFGAYRSTVRGSDLPSSGLVGGYVFDDGETRGLVLVAGAEEDISTMGMEPPPGLFIWAGELVKGSFRITQELDYGCGP